MLKLFWVLSSGFWVRYGGKSFGCSLFNACPATDRFFIPCSLPANRQAGSILFWVLSSEFSSEENLPGCTSDYHFLFFDYYFLLIWVQYGGKSTGLSIRLSFFISWLLFFINQGSLRRKIYQAVDPIIIFYFLIIIFY